MTGMSKGFPWGTLVVNLVGCMGYYVHNESNIGIAEGEAEVGYWIGKPFWNQGYCTEALREMIEYCFNSKGFLTLWADHFVDNPASGKVMEKCGFRDTGDMNGIGYLIPVVYARIAYGILLIVNAFVFWKIVLPKYRMMFSDESERNI